MSWRPSRSQFHTYGLAAASCTAEARQLTSITVGNPGVFELIGHGLVDGATGRFRAEGNPAEVPVGLASTSVYTVTTNGSDLFTVSLAGSPVAVTDVGEGVINWMEDLGAAIDAHLDGAVSFIEDHARAYLPPFANPVRLSIIKAVCEIAAYTFGVTLRNTTPSYSLEDLRKRHDDAMAWILRLNAGETLASNPVDASPDVSEAAAVAWQDWDNDGRGWDGAAGVLS
jgi:hypothetical protein